LSQNGAVERVVHQKELEDAVLRLLYARRVGEDLLALGDLDEARGHEHRPTWPGDVDQTHPAHAHRLHPRVVAKRGM